jgi:hypothetical protein
LHASQRAVGLSGDNLRVTTAQIPAAHAAESATSDPRERAAPGAGEGDNTGVNLERLAWLVTVLLCLIAVLVLALQGYFGYAGVSLAVAVAAAINLV